MRKFRLDRESKRILKNFSIFFGFIFGMCMILVLFTVLAHSSWKTGLAQSVQNVLDSYQEQRYTVAGYVELDSTISVSTAVYSLYKKDSNKNKKYYAVIMRIPSILGPLPSVFIYNEEEGVHFAGYALDNEKASGTADIQITSNIMNYWEKMIPQIIKKAKIK